MGAAALIVHLNSVVAGLFAACRGHGVALSRRVRGMLTPGNSANSRTGLVKLTNALMFHVKHWQQKSRFCGL
jgi:hypothetical protein